MRRLSIWLALVSLSSIVLAQTNTSTQVRQLSLQDAIQLALQHNLDLQIDRYNPQISLYNLKGSYGAYDPTLSFSGEHDRNETGPQLLQGGLIIAGNTSDANAFTTSLQGITPIGTSYTLSGRANDTYGISGQFSGQSPFESSVASFGMAVSQPLLKNFWIDANRLTIRVAKNRLKYSEIQLQLQMMQIVTRLEQAYYDLIYNQQNLTVQQKAVELAERLVMENRKRLEVGALAPLDLQSAEAQAASSRAAVIAARSQLDTQERLLKSFLTDQYRDWARVTVEPAGTLTAQPPLLNLQDSWSKGLSQRPELLQAKLDVDRQGIVLKYDKNQILPQVDAFGTYGYNGTSGKDYVNGSGGEFSDAFGQLNTWDSKNYVYGGRISFPLSNTRARNTYRADKATLQQLVLSVKQLEQSIMINIDNDIGTIRANFDQVQATRAAREYEEAALEAEQKKLESGKSTTYTVLQVQRDLTTARGNEIQALDTYNKSLSQLSLDEGSTLQRLGIRLEVQ
jgi:outer membrane protein TolC